MSRTIQIKRGLKADLPALAVGELGFTIDTHEVFIGSAAGNVPVESKESSELLVKLESDGAAMQSNITQLNNEVLAMSRGLGQSISSLAILNSTYPAGDTKDHIVAGNVKEVATLTVTAIPSVSANVTVTLDGVAHTLLANPLIHITTAALASAIRSQVFAGWVTGGTGNVVTFESTTVGPKGSHSFSGGTSGAAGSMVTTTEGEAANFHRYFWSGTAWLDGGVDFFTQEYKEAIEAKVLADFTAAENARQVEYDAAEAIRQAGYLQASNAAAANQELYDGLLEEGVLQTSINTKLAALELEYAPELTTLQQNDVTMSQQLADIGHNLTSYGVHADGVTDDAAIIQQAIDAVFALGGGTVLGTPNTTYGVSGTVRMRSNVILDLLGGTLKRIGTDKTKRLIENYNYGSAEILDKNFKIKNASIIGTGDTIGVSDAGHAISFWKVDGVLLDNIKTDKTNGDGIHFRVGDNVTLRDIEIGDYGRNGMSPCSGQNIVYDNIKIIGDPIVGANPGIDIDIENDYAIETSTHFMHNVQAKNIIVVDFWTADGGYFAHELYLNNCKIGDGYNALQFKSKNKTIAKNIVIGSNNIISGESTTSGSCIRIENVAGIKIKSPTLDGTNIIGTKIGVNIVGEVSDLEIDSPKLIGVTFGLQAYSPAKLMSSTIKNAALNDVYLTGSNNKFLNSKIRSLTIADATSADNVFDIGTKINSITLSNAALLATQHFGDTRGNQSKAFYSAEKLVTDGTTFDLAIPLPSAATNGRVLFLMAGYSHKGGTGHWAELLTTLRIGTLGAAEGVQISKAGTKDISILSVTSTSVTLRLTYQFAGVFSASIFG